MPVTYNGSSIETGTLYEDGTIQLDQDILINDTEEFEFSITISYGRLNS